MDKPKISEAKRKANAKWNRKNKDKMRFYRYHSAARVFIKDYARLDDLKKLRGLMTEREKKLKNSINL